MLYIDMPTRDEIAALSRVREAGCVAIYLKTTPVTQDIKLAQIELGNFTREALSQLQDMGMSKRDIEAVSEQLEDLAEDDEFWVYQAHSLAILVTPTQIRTWRLPNELTPMVVVSDRFHLKPLFRAITFPHSAFVLALSENSVRLVEVDADLPPQEIKVEDMPKDAASAAGLPSIKGRSHYRRMHGTEGQNVRIEQYTRKVDAALRPLLTGRETPLILAATGRTAKMFHQMNSYPHLLSHGIDDSPDRMTDAELAAAARPVLDAHYADGLKDLHALFVQRESARRTTTDLADAARAATQGAIEVLMVDIDTVIPGFVDDETGAITLSDSDEIGAYGVVDEIAVRALANGARVLGVRREDLPKGDTLAAILRYPR